MLLLASFAFADPVAELRTEGCLACHDVTHRESVGPPFGVGEGVAVEVSVGGEVRWVTRDEAYLLRAMTDPGAELRVGYPAGVMAPVPPERAERLLRAIEDLPHGSPTWHLPVNVVAIGSVLSVVLHLGLSAAAVRAPLVRRFGELKFWGLYSVPVGLAFAMMVVGWMKAPFLPVWAPDPWTRWVPLVLMPLVMIVQVAGYTTPSPTLAGQAGLLTTDPSPRGIHRITRHPVNLSTSLWALAHCLPNGDVASLWMFGSVAALGILGSLHIDARRAATGGEAWARYAAQTSLVPFAALLQGRTSWVWAELGWARVLGGLALFGAALLAHGWVLGASPYPTGW